ncbi:unnamed protein product [Prunus armeniaca]|uniref:Uncharacterized protein n=1 Tax=Prunus armeniaca TaxID=36596 RepID=A0A6J5VCC0_PRUAR|nr:unnamed protein product [Prunus armeniaca]
MQSSICKNRFVSCFFGARSWVVDNGALYLDLSNGVDISGFSINCYAATNGIQDHAKLATKAIGMTVYFTQAGMLEDGGGEPSSSRFFSVGTPSSKWQES